MTFEPNLKRKIRDLVNKKKRSSGFVSLSEQLSMSSESDRNRKGTPRKGAVVCPEAAR